MAQATIPSYSKIYGEDTSWSSPETLSCETIGERSKQHNWVINPHRHNHIHQFFAAFQGGVQASIDGVEHQLKAPLLISIPAVVVHGFKWQANSDGIVISCHSQEIPNALRDAPQLATLFEQAHCNDNPSSSSEYLRLKQLFASFHAEYAQKSPGKTAILRSLLTQILIEMSRSFFLQEDIARTAKTQAEQVCSDLMNLIDTHYAEPRTIDFYAQKLNITSKKLNRCTAKVLDQSVINLISLRRLREAKRLLSYTSMSANEIALSLGFKNPAYFSRFFKAKVGQTPGKFRNGTDNQGL